LGEQGELIDQSPMLDDLTLAYADDVDHVDGHLAASGRDPLELAGVRAVERLAGCDEIAFADLLMDLGPEAAERGTEPVELLADTLTVSSPGTRRRQPGRAS
jgi:hypothetical protein